MNTFEAYRTKGMGVPTWLAKKSSMITAPAKANRSITDERACHLLPLQLPASGRDVCDTIHPLLGAQEGRYMGTPVIGIKRVPAGT